MFLRRRNCVAELRRLNFSQTAVTMPYHLWRYLLL